jgi:hypothetical protein
MSFVLVDASIKLSNITYAQRVVLAGIASYADKSGKCWPSVATLAERINMSVRSVNRHIASLVNLGLLVRIYRAGRSAITRITNLVLTGLRPLATSANMADIPLPTWQTEPVTGTRQKTTAPLPILSEPVPTSVGTATAAIVVFDSIKPEASQPDAVNLDDAVALPTLVQADAVELPEAVNGLPVNAPKENLLGLPEDLREDLAALRRAKKKSPAITKTEAIFFANEAKKAGLTTAQAVRETIMRGWGRFEAKWLPPKPVEMPVRVYRPEVQQPAKPEVISAAKADLAALRERMKAPTDRLHGQKQILARHARGEFVSPFALDAARAALKASP